MLNDKKRLIPKYAVIPLICVFIVNMLSYMGSRAIAVNFHHYDLSLPIDQKIPMVEFFVVFYVLAYAQWVISYILIGRESKDVCYRFSTADIIAKIICFVVFITFPTTLQRPEASDNNIFGILTNLIFSLDSPDNLLPSIHCLESWVCFRGALALKKIPAWYKYFSLVFSIGVFMSTVLLKQHVLLDIPADILVFEIGMLIVRITKIDTKISVLFPAKNSQQ